MPVLIINRVLRREPVGLAYLKKFILSMDAPPIPLTALSSITTNFNVSLSSSLVYSKSDSPDEDTFTYMKSPDLTFSKPRHSSTTDEMFFSAIQSTVDKPQDTLTEVPEAHLNINNCNSIQPQTSQQLNQVEKDTSHLLCKTQHYVGDLAKAGDVTGSGGDNANGLVTDSTSHNRSVLFTISTGSDFSSVYNSTARDMDNVVISTGCQLPVMDDTGNHGNKTLLGAQSGEESQLPINSVQFDVFVSL